jgi:hypothetical protein
VDHATNFLLELFFRPQLREYSRLLLVRATHSDEVLRESFDIFCKCPIDTSSSDWRLLQRELWSAHYLPGYETMSSGRISPSSWRTFSVTIFKTEYVLRNQWKTSKHCLRSTRSWIWRHVLPKRQRNSILYIYPIRSLIYITLKLKVINLLKVVYLVIKIKSEYL